MVHQDGEGEEALMLFSVSDEELTLIREDLRQRQRSNCDPLREKLIARARQIQADARRKSPDRRVRAICPEPFHRNHPLTKKKKIPKKKPVRRIKSIGEREPALEGLELDRRETLMMILIAHRLERSRMSPDSREKSERSEEE